MKKYVAALLLAISLTGCRNSYDDNTVQDDMNDIGEDVRDGVNDIGDDIRDGANDLGDNLQDGYDDMTDYPNNNTNGTTDNPSNDINGTTDNPNGPYGNVGANLWSIPSFCNAVVGRPYYNLS